MPGAREGGRAKRFDVRTKGKLSELHRNKGTESTARQGARRHAKCMAHSARLTATRGATFREDRAPKGSSNQPTNKPASKHANTRRPPLFLLSLCPCSFVPFVPLSVSEAWVYPPHRAVAAKLRQLWGGAGASPPDHFTASARPVFCLRYPPLPGKKLRFQLRDHFDLQETEFSCP